MNASLRREDAVEQITLERAVKKVTKRLNLTGQAVVCPYAEVGMDVDKPFQLDMVEEYLRRRADG